MDIYDETFINFWKSSNKFQLKFIMIGGVATNLHGFYRTTADIDIWIEESPQNRENLYLVFKDIGLGDLKSLLTIQFIPGWTDFYLENGVRLDIMTSVKGLEKYSFNAATSLNGRKSTLSVSFTGAINAGLSVAATASEVRP